MKISTKQNPWGLKTIINTLIKLTAAVSRKNYLEGDGEITGWISNLFSHML